MIRVLVVDDHGMARQGLDQLLSSVGDMLVVGQACDGLEAVALCEQLLPDVVLMDITMPNMDGTTATQVIRQRYPDIEVILLTALSDIERSETMTQFGAFSVLSKDVPVNQLLDTVRAASREH